MNLARSWWILACMLASTALSSTSVAMTNIQVWKNSGWVTYASNVDTTATSPYVIDVDHIVTTINPAAGAVWIRVYNPSQAGSIGNLRFQSIVSGRVANVAIGILPNNAFQVGAPLPVASANLGGATRSGVLRLRLQVSISADCSSRIEADDIMRVDIPGLLSGDLIHWDNDSNFTNMGSVWLGGVAPNVLIRAVRGDMTDLRIFSDAEVDIRADDGALRSIVIDGDLGSTSNVSVVRSRQNAGATPPELDTLIVDSLFAIVGAGNSGTANIPIGTLEIDGDIGPGAYIYAGSLDNFVCTGSLEGSLGVASGVSGGESLSLGGGLSGVLVLPAMGLSGQVIINSNSGAAAWTGTVEVGSTTLTDGYAATASSLGGGSAGLVPFTLHDESSAPVNGAIILIYGMFPNQLGLECESRPFTKATLRMYGPVALDGSGPYFDVLKDGPLGFVPVSFTYAAAIKSGTGEREVEITKTSGGSAWPLGTYRIVPKAGKVTCLGAANNPDVDAFIYEFSLVDTCELGLLMMYDLNQDETVCMQDVAAWMSSPCDFNGDSAADAVDLNALMNVATTWAY